MVLNREERERERGDIGVLQVRGSRCAFPPPLRVGREEGETEGRGRGGDAWSTPTVEVQKKKLRTRQHDDVRSDPHGSVRRHAI